MSTAAKMHPAEGPQAFSALPSLPAPYDEQTRIPNSNTSPHSVPLYEPVNYSPTFPSPDSNRISSHHIPHQWHPARTYFTTQEILQPVIIGQQLFPETHYHTVEENGCWSLSHENIGTGRSSNSEHVLCRSQGDAAFDHTEDWASFLNTSSTPGRHNQTLPFLNSRPHISATAENGSYQSALMTEILCKPTKVDTNSRKDGEPKIPPILLKHYSKTPIHKQALGPSGKVQGEWLVFGAKQTQRSKSSYGANKRLTRGNKPMACARCKQIKQNCDWHASPYLPCKRCMNADPIIHKMPCIRILIPEIILFRLGPPVDNPDHPLNFFKHRKDLWTVTHERPYLEARTLELTQDMGYTLEVKVSPFVPLPGDKTAYEWESTEGPKRMEMPEYHISNIKDAKDQMIEYVNRSHMRYIGNLLDSSNEILLETFNMAARCKTHMVQQALILWATTRLTERTWRVCGKDTLGIEPPLEKLNPWNGIIPVTPIMDQQLDQIVIRHVLIPLRDFVLKELNTRLESRETAKRHFFEIYLAIFVLLNNAETQLSMEHQFAKRYGMSGRYGPYNKYKDAEDQFHAARTMLSYFHYICQGSIPLSISKKHLIGELEPDQVDYVIQLRVKVGQSEQKLRQLYHGNLYEKDLYWCHQLFFDHWKPGDGHIVELPPNTPSENQDPLPMQAGT